MKIAQLFSPFKNFNLGIDPLRDVTGISIDSRKIQPGQVFIAIKGTKHDSHEQLADACERGAIGLVVQDEKNVPSSFKGALLKVSETRAALVMLAKHYYGNPSEKLFCVGVTGTNGKTSTTYIVEALLNKFGMPTGVVGTINHHLGEKVWETELTTPDALTLQRRLKDFVALDARAVAFEISSHAIDQGRASGIEYAAVIFTNLTRDHLDYHGNMENYFATKERLFLDVIGQQSKIQAIAIVNTDDEWGRKIRVSSKARLWTYGESHADLQFQILEMSYQGTRFRLKTPRGEQIMESPLIGKHNVYNATAAIGAALAAGASLESCAAGLKSMSGIPGRMQRLLKPNRPTIFVDYAHTDDALKTALTLINYIRNQSKGKGQVIVVFGCGGDRDRGKRPLMAQAAIQNADYVFVTSDNPRTEDPLKIVQDILVDVSNDLMNSKVFVEIDRREAIRKAIGKAGPKDVILIAGKGHESYQIIGNKKYDFDDVQVAGEFLSGM